MRKYLLALVMVCLSLFLGFLLPARPSGWDIVPGVSLGGAFLGETVEMAKAAFGQPDFALDNGDGSFLMEWGVVPNTGNPPDAKLWTLSNTDDPKAPILKIGTDVAGYTYHGLTVGDLLSKFFEFLLLTDSESAAPGYLDWPHKGIGLAVDPSEANPAVHTIWVMQSE